VSGTPEEPRASYDPSRLDEPLTGELGLPVRRERTRLVGLDVRLALAPVEDVVGREVDDRCPEGDRVECSAFVDGEGLVALRLRTVDVRPRGRVQNEIRPRQALRIRIPYVPVLVRERERLDVREYLGERATELAARTAYDDLAEVAWSRSDRIGDCVLQSCLTRGSSQGTPCSSGSSGSYSSVTW
jgi:hypothetical protein